MVPIAVLIAQTRQSLCCLQTQSMDVEKDSDQLLGL